MTSNFQNLPMMIIRKTISVEEGGKGKYYTKVNLFWLIFQKTAMSLHCSTACNVTGLAKISRHINRNMQQNELNSFNLLKAFRLNSLFKRMLL